MNTRQKYTTPALTAQQISLPDRSGLEEDEEFSPYRPAALALKRGALSIQTQHYADRLRDGLLSFVQRLHQEQPLRDSSGQPVSAEWVEQSLRNMVNTLVQAEERDYPFWAQEGVVPDDPILYAYLQVQMDLDGKQQWELATLFYSLMGQYTALTKERGLSRRAVASLRGEGLRRLVPLEWLRTFAEQRETTLSRAWRHVQRHWNDPERTWPVGGNSSGLEEAVAAARRVERALKELRDHEHRGVLRWQVIGPGLLREYPFLAGLQRQQALKRFALDPGGDGTDEITRALAAQGDVQQVGGIDYYGDPGDADHFSKSAAKQGISFRENHNLTAHGDSAALLRQIFSNMTDLTTRAVERRLGNSAGVALEQLVKDLETLRGA